MVFKEQELLSALQEYPESMSLEQLRLACHVSKRKAAELVNSGRIKGYKTGSYTSAYKIPKKEVVRYLLTLGDKVDYVFNHGHPKIAGCQLIIEDSEIDPLIRYYTKYFKGLPDVLTTEGTSELLGYSTHTVIKWITEGYLESVRAGHRHYIPKDKLYKFMVTERFRFIPAKSEQHLAIEKKAQHIV